MAYVVGFPLLALLAVLQSAVLSDIRLLDGRADLVLLAVVAWALAERWTEALVWGMVGGLLVDLFSGVPFGSTSLILVVVVYVASLLEGRFWGAHMFLQMGVVMIASLVYHFYGLGWLVLMGRPVDVSLSLTRVLLPSTFLNLLLTLPGVQLARFLRVMLFPPEVKI
jgi:rod shape-determining protein MreD